MIKYRNCKAFSISTIFDRYTKENNDNSTHSSLVPPFFNFANYNSLLNTTADSAKIGKHDFLRMPQINFLLYNVQQGCRYQIWLCRGKNGVFNRLWTFSMYQVNIWKEEWNRQNFHFVSLQNSFLSRFSIMNIIKSKGTDTKQIKIEYTLKTALLFVKCMTFIR